MGQGQGIIVKDKVKKNSKVNILVNIYNNFNYEIIVSCKCFLEERCVISGSSYILKRIIPWCFFIITYYHMCTYLFKIYIHRINANI